MIRRALWPGCLLARHSNCFCASRSAVSTPHMTHSHARSHSSLEFNLYTLPPPFPNPNSAPLSGLHSRTPLSALASYILYNGMRRSRAALLGYIGVRVGLLGQANGRQKKTKNGCVGKETRRARLVRCEHRVPVEVRRFRRTRSCIESKKKPRKEYAFTQQVLFAIPLRGEMRKFC